MGTEFIWVILHENSFLFTNLFDYVRYIIARKLLGTFQYIEDLIAPHALINTAIHIEIPIVGLFLDLSSIGNEKTIVFEKMIYPQVWDIPQISDTLCGKKTHIL